MLQLKEMSESHVDQQCQLERVTRDKLAALAELELARGHVSTADMDYGKVTQAMTFSTNPFTCLILV